MGLPNRNGDMGNADAGQRSCPDSAIESVENLPDLVAVPFDWNVSAYCRWADDGGNNLDE